MGHGEEVDLKSYPIREKNIIEKTSKFFYDLIDRPVTWFRENVVVPNQKTYYWYHRQFRRVPTIDECYTDDLLCIFEAQEQFRRDKFVENNILAILRQRMEECRFANGPDADENCVKVTQDFKEAEENWYIKYGDLGYAGDVRKAFAKQKHRMVWERRHGPVGTGMRSKEELEARRKAESDGSES